MRFKYNPWVSMVALLLLATILVLVCTGCVPETEAAERDTTRPVITETTEGTEAAAKTEPAAIGRFSVEFAGFGFPHMDGIYIITDNQTGVQYLFVDKVDSGGLVKMEE